MNDTDKLIAAMFATSMATKASATEPGDFFGFYDACITEIQRREAVETAVKVERKLAAQDKAWG